MDIDPARTLNEFSEISGQPVESMLQFYREKPFFREYEAGKLSDKSFRDQIRKTLNISSSDQEIDEAWNAMLIGIPEAKMDLLKNAREKFKIFLLSNTNNIHRLKFEQFFDDLSDGEGVDSIFEKVYYSFLMDSRKPDPAVFLTVLRENSLAASETLVIDDNPENIEAAKSLSLPVLEVSMNQPIIVLPE